MTPLVSIIIPAYNYGAFIEECLNSVLDQTYQHFEAIVIDDGSIDNTQDVLKNFTDPRIRTVLTRNMGVSSARNTGLELARGDLIAFLDADDRWRPDKLESQVAIFNNCPEVGFVFTNFIRFDSRGILLADQFSFAPELNKLKQTSITGTSGYMLCGCAFTSLLELSDMPWYPTANMVRSCIAKNIRFSVNRKIAEDVEYFLKVWTNTKAAFIPEVKAELRRHSSNASTVLEFSHHMNMIDVLRGMRKSPLTAEQRFATNKRIGREWARLGYAEWHVKRYLKSASAYAHAIYYPDIKLNALKHLLLLPVLITGHCIKKIIT